MLYVSVKKPRTYPKGWIGQLVRALHRKSECSTDGAQNIILMVSMEEKLTPTKLQTWASRTVNELLEARFGLKQVRIGKPTSIRDIVCWKRTVVNCVLLSVGGECEHWLIAPVVMLQSR